MTFESDTLAILGGPVESFTAALRINGDDLDPDEISVMLGIQPTGAWRKGDQLLRGGREIIAIGGRWTLDSELSDTGDPERQIRRMLDRMTGDLMVWSALQGQYDMDLFCGAFMGSANQGFVLSAEILRRLGERGIKIGFDIYSADL